MIFNTIDKIMISWAVIRTITHTILWMTAGEFVSILGQSSDMLGTYFLVRMSINDIQDYDSIIKSIIIASIPIAIFMVIEQVTGGRNYFSVFGGVREWNIIRQGKLRAQGAFSHPILAGTFGATILPLAWGIWQRNKKITALSGFICAFVITLASSSSGPIATLGAGIFGVFFWIVRKYTKIIRNLFFVLLIILHFAMKAPVWHLIGRIDLVGGSTGYHRYELIDGAVRNFSRWFVLGIRSTEVWGEGLNDITNQYILEGALGGIVPLVLFVIIIIKCFQSVGSARAKLIDNMDLEKYVWSLGVVLFAHVISFISVSYFGQIVFFYYLIIGMLSNLNNLPSIIAAKKET